MCKASALNYKLGHRNIFSLKLWKLIHFLLYSFVNLASGFLFLHTDGQIHKKTIIKKNPIIKNIIIITITEMQKVINS